MATFILTYPLTVDLTTNHWGLPQGTIGRGGHSIVGICLHQLTLSMTGYMAYLQSPRRLQDIRPGEHGSMNYALEADGSIHQFVDDANTPWAVQSLSNPTWPLLGSYSGIDPNYLFIHVGLESLISISPPTALFQSIAQLIAYLSLAHTLPIDALHVITHDQLEDSYGVCASALFPNEIGTAQALANVIQEALPDVFAMAAQLVALQSQVDTLSSNFTSALANINLFSNHPGVIAGASTLGHIESSSTIDVNQSTGVASVKQLACAYTVTANTPQTLVTSIRAIVQFGTVLSDPLGWVTLGAFEHANITVNGLYRLQARLQFAAADWTAGKGIQLDCYCNGSLYRTLAIKTIEANLTAGFVDIAGECEILVTSPADYYDVRVAQNDATLTSPTKAIVDGTLTIEKVGA